MTASAAQSSSREVGSPSPTEASRTAKQVASESATASSSVRIRIASASEVLPVPVQQAAEASSSVATVVGAVSSPGAALQMARVVGVLQIAKRCRGNALERVATYDEALEFPQSLLPFLKFGDERGQYYRGAVVGNAVAVVGICLLAAIAGFCA